MTINIVVKWAKPINADEARERYIVREWNGDRCLIEFVCNLPIPPVTLARTAELTTAQDDCSASE